MAAISEILDVESDVHYYNDIINFEYHTHGPYANQKLERSDEVRIPINSMDHYCLPCRSFLLIEGQVDCRRDVKDDKSDVVTETTATYKLISNAMSYLFDEIRYELAGTSIAKSRLVGITSTIKALLLKNSFDKNIFHLAGFDHDGYTLTDNKFSFCIPLKLILPFFEDFKHVILNLKQELVLLRSSSDINCIESANGKKVSITLTKLVWKMPYIELENHRRLKFLKILDADRPLKLAFRKWEIHEYPVLPLSKEHSWTIRTTSIADIPKYVILAFQTNRKLIMKANMAKFDFCQLHNVKLYLNSQYYPYDHFLGSKELMYKTFLDFAVSYYNLPVNAEYGNAVDFNTFKSETPIFVIDCSHQSDHLKVSTDVRVEIEFEKAVPNLTTAYCILVSDTLIEYKPLTSLVREVQ
ncbi:uncharacterized protein LOC120353851 [Nilaparvata lugens]|uniref:uncharacterized protein LOC120353851 n=1 Tax=Nilaparvata lugens TaxID=108931 RepID=UPI00193DE4DE|nr:uncharacterized protein LOC120353851 [Nilaparvata lugens]